MIIDLPSTTTAQVNGQLVRLRDEVGAMALTRVLTLVVIIDETGVDRAVEIAMEASRQHPCRIIVLVTANRRGSARLDAQIRLGGDAGASEVVILRLYGPLGQHGRSVVTPLLLADSPLVVWWPGEVPADPSADPVGEMAQRRITDAVQDPARPQSTLRRLSAAYAPGDTDLAWARITLWRGLLAAALDEPPYEPIRAGLVTGAPDSPSADLLAGWLAHRLACPVTITRSPAGSGIVGVRLERSSGPLELERPAEGNGAILRQPGQNDRSIALPRRRDAECLADELRRLDPDDVYADALVHGLPAVRTRRATRPIRALHQESS